MKNLDTLFAVEFGQLLENYLFSSINRVELAKIISSSLGLRSENQLAQIYAGYDTPTTAAIFELIRTINDPEFTERFFKLQTTNMGGQTNGFNVATKTNSDVPTPDSEPPILRPEPSRNWENANAVCSDRLCDENPTRRDSETDWLDEDFDPNFLDL